MKFEENTQIRKIALLVSCASVLQIAESLLPHPIPGVRLGLANMITLVALIDIGFGAALEIAILRTVISSFILGTFLSPSFILSFSGSLVSTLVMGLFYKLTTLNRKPYLSIIGVSLLGAVSHNLVQISLVYLLMIKHKGVFFLLPWLGISSVIMGWIIGLVASQVCQKLENLSEVKTLDESKTCTQSSFKPAYYIHLNSPIHRLPQEIKIVTVFVLALVVLFLSNLLVYSFIMLLLISITFLSRVSFLTLFSGIRKLSAFIFFSFSIPLLFNTNGNILSQIGPLKITQGGLYVGALFAFRIILLMLSASLLIRTTSPEELTSGLKKLLFPIKIFGISEKRIAAIMMISWTSLPDLWSRIRNHIQAKKLSEEKLKKFIPALSDIIATLYMQTDYNSELKGGEKDYD